MNKIDHLRAAIRYLIPIGFMLFLGLYGGRICKMTIVANNEPGEPLIVTGRVFDRDGKTPVKGASVYVYHTDAEGNYSRKGDESGGPRIKGTLTTDAEGYYEFKTIKPGPYPGGGVAAHIHYVISLDTVKKGVALLEFEGDKYIKHTPTDEDRKNTFGTVRPLRKGEDGVWYCVKDIRMGE